MNERDKHIKALTKFYMSSDDTVKEETLEAIRFALKEIAANKEVDGKEVARKEPQKFLYSRNTGTNMSQRESHRETLLNLCHIKEGDSVDWVVLLEALRFAIEELDITANREREKCRNCAKFHQGWFCSHFQAKSQSDGFCHAFTELPF